MYDDSMISSLLDKMDIKGFYKDFMLNIIKAISNKIEELLSNMNLESNKLFQAVCHLAYRGKFIRGLYSYLMSRALGVDEKDAILLASSIELYHLASLIHDDIIDDADFRRGLTSVHKKYGINYAIIAGDTLIIYSNYLLTQLKKGVIKILAESGLKLSDGEALELEASSSSNIKEYKKIVYLKTASFFEGIFKSSAHLADRNDLINILQSIGRCIGYSFQYKDDIFDYIGDPKIIGKPKGIDINKSNLISVLMRQYNFSLEEAIKKANRMISECVSEAISLIKKLSIDTLYKKALIELTRSLEVRII